MFPEITVHRPRGVVPRLAVRKRVVVDYQPSWLLLALPVVAVAASRRRQAAAQPSTTQPAPRSGRRRLAVVRLVRLRRRPGGGEPVVEVTDVAVPVGQDGR